MRYLRLYAHFLRFSFSRAMEFRVDFFFRVIMDSMYYVFQFLFFTVLYLHTPVLAGWNQDQMTIFVAGYIFIDALNMTVFANNCWWFPIYINRGDLDYYLTKPVSTLFFLSFRDFAANSFLNLVIASSILVWAINSYPEPLLVGKIILFVLLLINGTLIYYLLHLLFMLPLFWTQSSRGFDNLFYGVTISMERPDRIYKGVSRFIFLYVLPFSLMASYPARILLETFQWDILLTMLGMTLLLYFTILQIWKLGLKNYSSASS